MEDGRKSAENDLAAGLPAALRWLVAAERVASVFLLLTILGLMAAQVGARYVLERPIPWSEELARFALIWLAFVAAAAVMAEGRHISVDVISKYLGRRGALASECVVSLAILGVCAAFLPAGIQFIQQLGGVKSSALQIPMGCWYGAAVTGFALLAFHTVVNLVMAFRRGSPLRRDHLPPVEMEPGGKA